MILIIDDNQTFCRLLKRGLESHGYVVEVRHDSKSSLAAVEQYQPDFVLLDLRLGYESGLALIEPIKAINEETKILVLTGYASLATAVQAIKLGASNYLSKPVDDKRVHRALLEMNSDEEMRALINEPPQDHITLKSLEWEYIQQVLQENNGNISETARQLDVHRRTLQRKLQKHSPSN